MTQLKNNLTKEFDNSTDKKAFLQRKADEQYDKINEANHALEHLDELAKTLID